MGTEAERQDTRKAMAFDLCNIIDADPSQETYTKMGQADKQFGGFLRLVIAQLKKAIAAQDIDTMRTLLQELLTDLQNTLED